MPVSATDMFSGGGGGSEGARQAGVDIWIAANHEPVAIKTHKINHPDTEHRCKDLSEVDWTTFPSTDILIAGPSCVWHARSGGRKKAALDEEKRRKTAGAIDRATAFAVVEAAEVHRYPVLIIENVPEFQAWVLFPAWLMMLEALGYKIEIMVLNAADFGLPQHRKRLIMIATLREIEIDLSLPEPVHVPASTIINDDPGKPVSRRLYVADQIDSITEDRVPHLVTYRRNAKAQRADQNVLATVTAGGNHHAVAQVIDGKQYHRLLSNRECARSQGFPDHYVFAGDSKEVKKQIGNAMPVNVIRWASERAVAALAA